MDKDQKPGRSSSSITLEKGMRRNVMVLSPYISVHQHFVGKEAATDVLKRTMQKLTGRNEDV
jgi:hypothetical protein